MKKNILCTQILLISLLVCCSSLAEQLKSDNPALYSEIVGKWNVLSAENPSTVLASVTFKENGEVEDPSNIVLHGNMMENYHGFQWYCSNRGVIETIGFDSHGNKSYSGSLSYIITDEYINRINPVLIKFRTRIGFKPSYYYKYDLIVVREKDTAEIVNAITDNINTEKSDWDRVEKKSVIKTIEFIKGAKHEVVKKMAVDSLHILLDDKTKVYLSKNYKQYASLIDNDIVYEDGTKVCKFYEFFKGAVTAINPISGTKIQFNIMKKDSDEFIVETSVNNASAIISFKSYKNNVVVTSMTLNGNSRGWEYAFKILADAWNVYPDIENIDVDLLEKL